MGQNNELDVSQRKSFLQLLPIIINDVAKHVFHNAETSYKTQRKYMSNSIFIGNLEFVQFSERLENMNILLSYFPRFGNQAHAVPLDDDQLIDIVERRAPLAWFPIMTERKVLL